MTDKDFENVIELVNVGGGFMPANEAGEELMLFTKKGEVISFMEVTKRDLSFHKCYFSLLSLIYDYLPMPFKKKVPKKHFHNWLKHLKKQYTVTYSFNDGTELIEYDSISFGKMSQKTFEKYIADQMPFIYENVLGKFFEGEMYDNIIATIETEYERFFAKLL